MRMHKVFSVIKDHLTSDWKYETSSFMFFVRLTRFC